MFESNYIDEYILFVLTNVYFTVFVNLQNIKNLVKQSNSLTGWTDAAIAIISSGSIGGSINASTSQGNTVVIKTTKTYPDSINNYYYLFVYKIIRI